MARVRFDRTSLLVEERPEAGQSTGTCSTVLGAGHRDCLILITMGQGRRGVDHNVILIRPVGGDFLDHRLTLAFTLMQALPAGQCA